MKKITLSILLLIVLYGCKSQRSPMSYETTWLELTETDDGYVVYNYPDLWNDGETSSPEVITIKNDSLIWNTFSDPLITRAFTDVQFDVSDSSYLFPVGNYFRFQWANKEKHIARWIIYTGKEQKMRVMFDRLYVDSLYNPYPVVDYVWDLDEPIVY